MWFGHRAPGVMGSGSHNSWVLPLSNSWDAPPIYARVHRTVQQREGVAATQGVGERAEQKSTLNW